MSNLERLRRLHFARIPNLIDTDFGFKIYELHILSYTFGDGLSLAYEDPLLAVGQDIKRTCNGYLEFPVPEDTAPQYSIISDEYGSFMVCPFDSGVYRVEMEVALQDSLRLVKFEKPGYCIGKAHKAVIPQTTTNLGFEFKKKEFFKIPKYILIYEAMEREILTSGHHEFFEEKRRRKQQMTYLRRDVVVLSCLLLMVSQSFAGTGEYTSYLFTYFVGNDSGKKQESIFFALSDDAHTFKKLNKGNPILSSSKISLEGGIRDPHILRGENNDYYMVATDMVSAKGWASNHGIVMLKSTNLLDWKSSTVDIRTAFPQYQVADRVWAPQTIYDPVEKKYMVYFAMRLGSNDKDKIYYAYADSSFTKLESAPKLLYKYGNNSAIDADIIYKDSLYHLFFKTEQSGNGIKSATSKKLTEGYVLIDKYLQLTSEAVEGSCVFKLINSDTWILMYDVYNSGKYEFATSTDLRNFTKDPKPISFDFTPRHGTIIPITDDEKKALLAKWNPTEVAGKQSVAALQSFMHNVRGNVLELTFGKQITNATIVLFDASGKIVQRQIVFGTSATVDIAGVSAGVYQVLCRTNTGDITGGRIIAR